MPTDTITHPPAIPRGMDPQHAMTQADVEALVDSRIRAYHDQQVQQDASRAIVNVRQRMMTYGVSGMAGLGMGVGVTLLIQRIRRGRVKP